MKSGVSDMACAILRATNDGDDLDKAELWVVQEACNDHLNEFGWDKFEEIYEKYITETVPKDYFRSNT